MAAINKFYGLALGGDVVATYYKTVESQTHYTHTQTAASKTWIINHNLGYQPNVLVIDSAGSQVFGEIAFLNANSCSITFSGEMSGQAFCS